LCLTRGHEKCYQLWKTLARLLAHLPAVAFYCKKTFKTVILPIHQLPRYMHFISALFMSNWNLLLRCLHVFSSCYDAGTWKSLSAVKLDTRYKHHQALKYFLKYRRKFLLWIHWYYVFQQRLLVAVKIYKCGCQNTHVQNWSKLIQYDKSRLTAYMNYKIGVNLLPICISWLYTICVFGMLLATFTTSPALSFTFSGSACKNCIENLCA
jgi:hypothetical protein